MRIKKPAKPLPNQRGSKHYTDLSIQPWQAMQSWMSPEQFEGYLRGNVIKYIARYPAKDGLADLIKAQHYLDELVKLKNA